MPLYSTSLQYMAIHYIAISSTRGDDQNEGVQLERRDNQTRERVWYHPPSSGPLTAVGEQCPFPVGEDRVLDTFTNSAPVFSINIGMILSTHTLHS